MSYVCNLQRLDRWTVSVTLGLIGSHWETYGAIDYLGGFLADWPDNHTKPDLCLVYLGETYSSI